MNTDPAPGEYTPATDPIIQQYNALIEWYLINRPHETATIERLEKKRDDFIKEIYPTAQSK